MAGNMFSGMRRAGFSVGVSQGKLTQIMLEILIQLPVGTESLKDTVVAHMGLTGQMSSTRELNAAWTAAKKKAAKQHPDMFLLGSRNILLWNDGSVKLLDKKITAANFRKLNELAEDEECTVNQLITKLIRHYRKGK